MDLLTPELRAALRANADASASTAASADARDHDPAPVVKFFSPVGAATWLAIELDTNGDTLFGLADLGFGCPELGSFSLAEIEALRLPFGLTVERDLFFASSHPLSVWAAAARSAGSILWAERLLGSADAQHRGNAVEGERLLGSRDAQHRGNVAEGERLPGRTDPPSGEAAANDSAPRDPSDPDQLPPPKEGGG